MRQSLHLFESLCFSECGFSAGIPMGITIHAYMRCREDNKSCVTESRCEWDLPARLKFAIGPSYHTMKICKPVLWNSALIPNDSNHIIRNLWSIKNQTFITRLTICHRFHHLSTIVIFLALNLSIDFSSSWLIATKNMTINRRKVEVQTRITVISSLQPSLVET